MRCTVSAQYFTIRQQQLYSRVAYIVLCGTCEMVLKTEHRMTVSGNKILKKISVGPKIEDLKKIDKIIY